MGCRSGSVVSPSSRSSARTATPCLSWYFGLANQDGLRLLRATGVGHAARRDRHNPDQTTWHPHRPAASSSRISAILEALLALVFRRKFAGIFVLGIM